MLGKRSPISSGPQTTPTLKSSHSVNSHAIIPCILFIPPFFCFIPASLSPRHTTSPREVPNLCSRFESFILFSLSFFFFVIFLSLFSFFLSLFSLSRSLFVVNPVSTYGSSTSLIPFSTHLFNTLLCLKDTACRFLNPKLLLPCSTPRQFERNL